MKRSNYNPMASVKPENNQYIHFITTTGRETYGWYRGDVVDVTLNANKDGENPPVNVTDIAAWRPITMKPL